MIQRLALSGEFRAGKDWIADLCGYKILSFSAPMYEIAKYFFGDGFDKNLPDCRWFLQYIGQIGWGHHDQENYRYTVERGLMVDWCRRNGADITGRRDIDWSQFGKKQTFWVDFLTAEATWPENYNAQLAVVNVRYPHEAFALTMAGFQHYLVASTRETRVERNGCPIPEKTENDCSEHYARSLRYVFADDQIIWNDHRQMPKLHKYLTVEEFVKLATE